MGSDNNYSLDSLGVITVDTECNFEDPLGLLIKEEEIVTPVPVKEPEKEIIVTEVKEEKTDITSLLVILAILFFASIILVALIVALYLCCRSKQS